MRALRGWLDRLGAAGVAGLGILAFCVPFYFSALAPHPKSISIARMAIADHSSGRP